MMFQIYALFPHLTVLDNVAFSLKMRGMPKAERRASAREMLALVDMEAFADRLPAQLSGGQQQRVALARALITQPSCCFSTSRSRRSILSCASAADGAEAAPERARHHLRPRHPRPGRGAWRSPTWWCVMNAGRIEQAGHAARGLQPAAHRLRRPLHRRPQRDALRAARLAVRADRLRCRRDRGRRGRRTGWSPPCRVEYQGAIVQIGLAATDGTRPDRHGLRGGLRRDPSARRLASR